MFSTFNTRQTISHSTHWLIDPLLLDDRPSDWPWERLSCGGQADRYTEYLPLLLPLDALTAVQKSYLEEWLDHMALQPNVPMPGIFLTSSAALEALHKHLGSALWTPVRQLLRYYDPRVFIQLLWMFTPGQLHTFFGPILHWHFPLGGGWHRTCEQQSLPEPEKFSPDVWKRLQRIGLINATWQQISQQITPQDNPVQYTQTSQRIDRLLEQAQHRIPPSQRTEIIQFVLSALQHNESAHQPSVIA